MSTPIFLAGRVNDHPARELREAYQEIERLQRNERALRSTVADLQRAIRDVSASFLMTGED